MGSSRRGRALRKNAPLEKDFQTRVLIRLRKLPLSFWFKINDRTTVGIPDIVGAVNGYSIAIELKTRERLTRIQHYHLEKIDLANCQSFVVTPGNWEEVFLFISSLLTIEPPRIAQLRKPARIPLWCLPAGPRWDKKEPLIEPEVKKKNPWVQAKVSLIKPTK